MVSNTNPAKMFNFTMVTITTTMATITMVTAAFHRITTSSCDRARITQTI